jgi:hypothetical protein
VLSRGRIVVSGGPELADELERTGYAGWAEEEEAAVADAGAGAGRAARPEIDDPFGGPGETGPGR